MPDNRYAIYLVQAQTDQRRKVIEVVVRNGRVIDPGDDSEGARDRPPTEESATQPNDAVQPPVDGSEPAAGDQTEASPLAAPAGAAAATDPSSAALRHGRVIAGAALCLSAAGRPWARQVEKALAQAKPSQWRRLRTAGHFKRRPR